MDEVILEKILNTAERFFGTVNDPEQMPVSKESLYKLQKLHPKTFLYKTLNNEPVSWTVVLPTSKELAEKFIQGKINERELLDMTEPKKEYEALYLCSAFTVPEHRRKGYAIEMLKEAIDGIPHAAKAEFFVWPYSEEGGAVIKKLEEILGRKIKIRKK